MANSGSADSDRARRAELLRALYVHSGWRHNVVIAGPPKEAPVRSYPPRQSAYLGHLDSTSPHGIDALGVDPVIPETPGVENTVRFLVLDSDAFPFDRFEAWAATLERRGVTPLTHRGTTGRDGMGGQVHILLDAPVPLPDAEAYLADLKADARDHGIVKTEVFPSNGTKGSSMVFLPYRGSGDDGFGFNPLRDPRTGEDIQLEALAGNPRYLTPASAIPERTPRQPVARRPLARPTRAPVPDAEAMWMREVARVQPLWLEGRRQSLAKGLAAYGAAFLCLPQDRVFKDLMRLEEASPDREIDKRAAAIRGTFDKIDRGVVVGITSWFRKANVEPPVVTGIRPGVRRHLATLERLLRDPHHWPGRGGHSERSVMWVLLDVGLRYGVETNAGVRFGLDQRTLSELASQARRTTQRTLRRLSKQHLVRWRKRGSKAGTIEILRSGVDTKWRHSPTKATDEHDRKHGGQDEWRHFAHAAFRLGGLNASGAHVVCALMEHDGPMTMKDLIERIVPLNVPATVRAAVKKCVEHDVVLHHEDGTYSLARDLLDRLDRVATRCGIVARKNRMLDRHDAERLAYHRRFDRADKDRDARLEELGLATAVFRGDEDDVPAPGVPAHLPTGPHQAATPVTPRTVKPRDPAGLVAPNRDEPRAHSLPPSLSGWGHERAPRDHDVRPPAPPHRAPGGNTAAARHQ